MRGRKQNPSNEAESVGRSAGFSSAFSWFSSSVDWAVSSLQKQETFGENSSLRCSLPPKRTHRSNNKNLAKNPHAPPPQNAALCVHALAQSSQEDILWCALRSSLQLPVEKSNPFNLHAAMTTPLSLFPPISRP
jgi:hypothetical protein